MYLENVVVDAMDPQRLGRFWGALLGFGVVAGLLEGFVTGSPLPTWARVGIGVVVWAAFGTYVVRLGRDATDGLRRDHRPGTR